MKRCQLQVGEDIQSGPIFCHRPACVVVDVFAECPKEIEGSVKRPVKAVMCRGCANSLNLLVKEKSL